MERSWELPNSGYIKVNVHAITHDEPLPNGNQSGIGVVLRDEDGDILLMVSGTIRNLTSTTNELWALLVGLRCAFYENEHNVILEIESADAVKEWEEWHWYYDPNHRGVIDQLEIRKKDKRLKLEVNIIQQSQNLLARFLTVDGAMNRQRLVVFRRMLGCVREIWHLDMGLGLVSEGFDMLEEKEYNAQQPQEIGDELDGVGDWLIDDGGSDNRHI